MSEPANSPAPELVLTRFAYGDEATFGRLSVDGRTLYTVERPWRSNLPRVSCIPEGRYRCRPRMFFRGGYPAIEVLDVPGRSHILFHVGNRAGDVEGCIAIGTRLGSLADEWAVLESRTAFAVLMASFGGREFDLQIEQVEGAIV